MIVAVISVNFYIFLYFFFCSPKKIYIAGLQRDLNPLLLRFLALQCSTI